MNETNRWCGLLILALGLFVLYTGVAGLLGGTLIVPPKTDSAFVAIIGSVIVLLGGWCFRQP